MLVNVLSESIASPAVGVQPSWAHVVKGGVSVVPSPPPLPPRPQPQVNARTITSEILKIAKSSLKHVEQVVKNPVGVGKVVNVPVVPVSKPVGNELVCTHPHGRDSILCNHKLRKSFNLDCD